MRQCANAPMRQVRLGGGGTVDAGSRLLTPAERRARADGLLLLGSTFSGGSKGVAAGVDGLNILAQQASVGLSEAAAAVNRLFAKTCAPTTR
jgi:hypothetical protein